MLTTAQSLLKDVFGYDTFRPLQRDIIENVLKKNNSLVIMPTGGGKSLCYQLPAVVGDGLTLVVSPLIALMKDQVDQLTRLGLPVSFINSTLSTAEQHARLQRMAAGQYCLVYVVPERFRSGRFLEAVRAVGLRLLAVDEALNALVAIDEQRASIVEMRFFSGMTVKEVANVLEISEKTVGREWAATRLWLRRFMTENSQ